MLLEMSHEIDLALHVGAEPVATGVRMTEHEAWITLGPFTVNLSDRSSEYRRQWRLLDEPRGSYDICVESPADLAQTYVDELAHFLRAVEGGAIAPGCTLEEGIAVLDVITQVKGMNI